jgi:hypothetical protein
VGAMVENVLVPAPPETEGIIISLFPTNHWKPTYHYAMSKDPDLSRFILFADAMPGKMIREIARAKKDAVSEEEYQNLCKFVYEKMYWTHLYKQFADSEDEFDWGEKSNSFRYLSDEVSNLLRAKPGKIKVIIGLGNSNWDFLELIEGTAGYLGSTETIRLPIPVQPGSNYYSHPKYQIEIDRLIALANVAIKKR